MTSYSPETVAIIRRMYVDECHCVQYIVEALHTSEARVRAVAREQGWSRKFLEIGQDKLRRLHATGVPDVEIAREHGQTVERVQYLRRTLRLGEFADWEPNLDREPRQPRPLVSEARIRALYGQRRYSDELAPKPAVGRLPLVTARSYVGCAAAWCVG